MDEIPNRGGRGFRSTVLIALAGIQGLLGHNGAFGQDLPSMVIVTTEEQRPAYERLADLKTTLGVPTSVTTLDTIQANYTGVDLQERIRRFLVDVSSTGVSYCLLGGSADVIPYRLARTEFFGGAEIPTDLYYSDLDGDWDGDGNGVYGQYTDGLDLAPDLYVGRIPSDSLGEADGTVDKLVSYVLDGPADLSILWAAQGTAVILCEEVADRLPEGASVTYLYDDTVTYPFADSLTTGSLFAALSNRQGLVHLATSGAQGIAHVGDDTVHASDVGDLKNPVSGPLLATIEFSVGGSVESIGEAWVTSPEGGGIATWGHTHYDFKATDCTYQNEMLRIIYEEGDGSLGRAAARAKEPFILFSQTDNTHRWTQFALNLLADPELWIWTAPASPLTMEHETEIRPGEPYMVRVLIDGAPVPGARVTLRQDPNLYLVQHTGTDGGTTFSFGPLASGPVLVSAWVPNAIPAIDTARIASTGATPITPQRFASSPNPFSLRTSIDYSIPADDAGRVRLTVLNLRGQVVRSLLDCRECPAGSVVWDGKGDHGARLPSGVYVYLLQTDTFYAGQKGILLRTP